MFNSPNLHEQSLRLHTATLKHPGSCFLSFIFLGHLSRTGVYRHEVNRYTRAKAPVLCFTDNISASHLKSWTRRL